MSTPSRQQLETEIEQKHADLARANGWFVEKIMRTGRGGFPDRLYAKAGRVVLVEWKRPGKNRTTKQQLLRHKELRDAGVEVHIVYSIAEIELVLRMENYEGGIKDTRTRDMEEPGWRVKTGLAVG
jgi:Casjensviridae endonuclease